MFRHKKVVSWSGTHSSPRSGSNTASKAMKLLRFLLRESRNSMNVWWHSGVNRRAKARAFRCGYLYTRFRVSPNCSCPQKTLSTRTEEYNTKLRKIDAQLSDLKSEKRVLEEKTVTLQPSFCPLAHLTRTPGKVPAKRQAVECDAR